jgi:superfamily I DNA/RNA helicase
MSRDVTILFGGPGTGKTTYLIKVVEQALRRGVDPSRIAYMSFSKKAARQAVERAMDPNGPLAEYRFSQEHFPWFRTLHSAAYRVLELGRHNVMTSAHFKELGSAIGLVFNGSYEIYTEHAPIDLTSLGDRCLAIYARAKARCWTLEEEWRYANEWDLPWAVVRGFASHLDGYKRDRGVIDFTDMIDMAQEPLDVDLLILDEAQDMSVQQWGVARRFGANAKEIYLAGDDDQAIYSFSGSTVTPLLSLRGKRVVLPLSRRLPRNIKAVADKVSANIKIREPKQFSARDADGLDTWVREPDDVDLSHGTWLLLCRNRSQVAKLEAIARRQNVVYHARGQWSNQEDTVRAVVAYERIRNNKTITATEAKLIQGYLRKLLVPDGEDSFTNWTQLGWPFESRPNWMEALELPGEDREYIRGLRRRGESLRDPGRVTISTVHGAKGGEADNVLLLTDVSGRVARGMLSTPDDEWRVVYVGVSRAKEALYLAQPSTRNFWSIAA